jgi:hypothetical protein
MVFDAFLLAASNASSADYAAPLSASAGLMMLSGGWACLRARKLRLKLWVAWMWIALCFALSVWGVAIFWFLTRHEMQRLKDAGPAPGDPGAVAPDKLSVIQPATSAAAQRDLKPHTTSLETTYCVSCGAPVSAAWAHCNRCGAPLPAADEASPQWSNFWLDDAAPVNVPSAEVREPARSEATKPPSGGADDRLRVGERPRRFVASASVLWPISALVVFVLVVGGAIGFAVVNAMSEGADKGHAPSSPLRDEQIIATNTARASMSPTPSPTPKPLPVATLTSDGRIMATNTAAASR